MPSVVDLNRGVLQAIMRDGRTCCMYLDDPGVYFDTHGNPMTEEEAREAGFEVERLAKEHRRVEKIRAAEAEVAAERAAEGEEEERAPRGRGRRAAAEARSAETDAEA